MVDLAYAGHPLSKVAREVNVGEAVIRHLKRPPRLKEGIWVYREPHYDTGQRLVIYYQTVLGRTPPTRDGKPQLHRVSSYKSTPAIS